MPKKARSRCLFCGNEPARPSYIYCSNACQQDYQYKLYLASWKTEQIARLLKAFSFRGAFDRLYSHHHLQHYNNKSLANLVKDGGFEIISHKNHNFPLKSVDLPKTNTLIKWIYVSGVAIVFGITNLFGGGLCQTIICKK